MDFRKRSLNFLRGRAAERACARWLKQQGYRILARNFRIGRDEIDIVARLASELVLVEVRFRSAGLGYAADSLSPKKLKSLRRAHRSFLHKFHLPFAHARLDFVAVSREGRRWQFEHRIGLGD